MNNLCEKPLAVSWVKLVWIGQKDTIKDTKLLIENPGGEKGKIDIPTKIALNFKLTPFLIEVLWSDTFPYVKHRRWRTSGDE